MSFELGKTYYHPAGKRMRIVGCALTKTYGECYVGENLDTGELSPVGKDEGNAQNWEEVTK